MRIVRIEPHENGGHDNQTTHGTIPVPDGWAVIPDEMITYNFPFGEIVVEEIEGVMTVTSWTPGVIPEPDPVPVPDDEASVWDELDTAYQEGVNGAYDQ